ncbi:hypothetical protein BKA58DRAFT_437055 [Alternaria rosae]|uniref:uncharacterized protein n=1 Tax=Alternaria rosae TaxID=1187941 RepID=UPI001E8D42C8|nr:uncharacterized protein BKA58DRAFT_437055 [Alternaria rosae]KAH6875060.1 hypothetical protein BKA58DRAFT_437055 [Alternaria rosae]
MSLRLTVLWLLQYCCVNEAEHPTSCRHAIVRKEWRTLKRTEQLQYITAVQCLLEKPAVTPTPAAPGALSRYDDLVATHINQTLSIHLDGQFLPWHRLFTAYYEKILRDECGYRGAQPYWDWTLDTPAWKFVQSPVFDATYGFGGNGPFIPPPDASNNTVPGRTGGGCVEDGPFMNITVHLGPLDSLARNDQCLRRDLAPEYAATILAKSELDKVMAQADYGWFARTMEGGTTWDESQIHTGGHISVGGAYGQMSDGWASPSDPIFWLHHANLDRVWWSWQTKDLETRLRDMSGPVMLRDWDNTQGGNVTLDFPLSLGYNGWDAKISDVMDIRDLCYSYDELY